MRAKFLAVININEIIVYYIITLKLGNRTWLLVFKIISYMLNIFLPYLEPVAYWGGNWKKIKKNNEMKKPNCQHWNQDQF